MQMVTPEMVLVRAISIECFPVLKKWVCLFWAFGNPTLQGLFPTQRHNKPLLHVLTQSSYCILLSIYGINVPFGTIMFLLRSWVSGIWK